MSLRPVVLKRSYRLSDEDWSSLRGSDLHAMMTRNRVIAVQLGIKSRKIIETWLHENCGDIFYISAADTLDETHVYFASETDMTHFFLSWQGVTPTTDC